MEIEVINPLPALSNTRILVRTYGDKVMKDKESIPYENKSSDEYPGKLFEPRDPLDRIIELLIGIDARLTSIDNATDKRKYYWEKR